MFSLICAWINGWVNNREAGDLKHHHAHYDVTLMTKLNIKRWKSTQRTNWRNKHVSLFRTSDTIVSHANLSKVIHFGDVLLGIARVCVTCWGLHLNERVIKTVELVLETKLNTTRLNLRYFVLKFYKTDYKKYRHVTITLKILTKITGCSG